MKNLSEYPRLCVAFEPGCDAPSKQNGGIPSFQRRNIMNAYIYALTDPRDQEIRYIGCTTNLKRRMWSHQSIRYTNLNSVWIIGLVEKGLYPIIDLIDIVPVEDHVYWERFYISEFRKKFRLYNTLQGGEGVRPGLFTGENNPMYGIRLTGEKNHFFGKTHTEATREILRKKCGHVGLDKVWNKGKTNVYSKELTDQMKMNQPTRRPIKITDMEGNVLHRFISKKECIGNLPIDPKQLDYILEKKKRGPIYNGMIFYYETA